jgi:FkbM family methyltransferase
MYTRVRLVLRRLLGLLGLRLSRITVASSAELRRMTFLATRKIDTVVDIGANSGQFGMEVMNAEFRGRVISFEPLASAFSALRRTAAAYPKWEVYNVGIGDIDGSLTLNVADNSASSSLRKISHHYSDPGRLFKYVGQENVHIRKLDSILADQLSEGNRLFVKIDVQGFEGEVLAGMTACLKNVEIIEIELTLKEIYAGQATFDSLHTAISHMGYRLIAIAPVITDRDSGELLQLDATYARPQ